MAASNASDFNLFNNLSFFLLEPVSNEAKAWASDNLGDAQRLGNRIFVESRFAESIVSGITEDGLTIQ